MCCGVRCAPLTRSGVLAEEEQRKESDPMQVNLQREEDMLGYLKETVLEARLKSVLADLLGRRHLPKNPYPTLIRMLQV